MSSSNRAVYFFYAFWCCGLGQFCAFTLSCKIVTKNTSYDEDGAYYRVERQRVVKYENGQPHKKRSLGCVAHTGWEGGVERGRDRQRETNETLQWNPSIMLTLWLDFFPLLPHNTCSWFRERRRNIFLLFFSLHHTQLPLAFMFSRTRSGHRSQKVTFKYSTFYRHLHLACASIRSTPGDQSDKGKTRQK